MGHVGGMGIDADIRLDPVTLPLQQAVPAYHDQTGTQVQAQHQGESESSVCKLYQIHIRTTAIQYLFSVAYPDENRLDPFRRFCQLRSGSNLDL